MAIFDNKTQENIRIVGEAEALAPQESDVTKCLEQAQNAEDADVSRAAVIWAEQADKLDPDNIEAWKFLARNCGWDSKMFVFDMDAALKAIRHCIDLVPETASYELAAEIYNARKRQISAQLESNMTMPSYTSSKRLHDNMMDWKRFLEEIPALTPELLESEIILCTNLCKRSKNDIMPQNRLIYSTYCQFNGKENYGDTFRKALAFRKDETNRRREEKLLKARKYFTQRKSTYAEKRSDGSLSPEEEKAWIEEDMAGLTEELERIVGLSNRAQYEQQAKELERQYNSLKSYKLVQRRQIDDQLKAAQNKVAQIDDDLEQQTAPLKEYFDTLQKRQTELDAES